jgi:hypothetical protein
MQMHVVQESPGSERGQPDDGRLIAESWLVPERFGVVFDRHTAAIHCYIARRLGRDAADDLVGETFLVAFGWRGGYDPEQPSARPWLYGIATRLVSRRAGAMRCGSSAPSPAPGSTQQRRSYGIKTGRRYGGFPHRDQPCAALARGSVSRSAVRCPAVACRRISASASAFCSWLSALLV